MLVFLKQIGNGMVWSVIAVYGQSLGGSAAVVGLLVSAYGGARLMVNVPAGYASETFGRRAMMLAGCVAVALASFAAVLFSNLGTLFGALLLMGVASAFFVTAALAAVADLGTPGSRVKDMSLYQSANMIGTSMGPALGGIAAGFWGFEAPFVVNGLIAVSGILAFVVLPMAGLGARAAIESREQRSTTAQLRTFARQGAFVGLMCFAIYYVRTASNWVLMPLIAQSQFGLDMATIGLILTGGAIANLCVLTVVAKLAARYGRVQLIVLSSTLTLVGCAMLAFGNDPIYCWLSSIVFGAGSGVAMPTLTAYVADKAPADQRGPAMGLLRTMQDFALILGPFVTGLLSDHLGLGYQGGLLGCLVVLTGATVVFRWSARKN